LVPATNGSEPAPGGGHNSQAGAELAVAAVAADAPEALLCAAEAEVRIEPIPAVVDAVVLDSPLGVDVVDRVGVAREPVAPDWLTAAVAAVPANVGVVMDAAEDAVDIEFAPVVLDGVAVVPVEPVGVAAVCAVADIGKAVQSRAVRPAAPRQRTIPITMHRIAGSITICDTWRSLNPSPPSDRAALALDRRPFCKAARQE
jgi:hypothetical protein